MKRFIGIFISVFAVFLMSHNASAASTIVNNLQNYQTNLIGIGNSQGYIRFQDSYSFTGTNNYSYIANGEFLTSWDWNYGHEYQVIFVETVDASGVDLLVPNPIYIEGDNYHTEEDNIQSSISCGSSSCKYTMIHTLKVVADDTGSEVVKIPSSVILNIKKSGSQVSGKFNLYVVLFDNVDEAMAFRSNLLNKLDDINSDTTDIKDALDDINDKLDQLDTNADKNAEAWDNMQNTDGLVDTGDTTQLLSIVGVITTVFDSIKNAPMSESCSIDANFGGLFGDANTSFNMGAINLCRTLPSWVADIGGFVMTTITFVAVLFMLIGCVNAINKYMDWLRRN